MRKHYQNFLWGIYIPSKIKKILYWKEFILLHDRYQTYILQTLDTKQKEVFKMSNISWWKRHVSNSGVLGSFLMISALLVLQIGRQNLYYTALSFTSCAGIHWLTTLFSSLFPQCWSLWAASRIPSWPPPLLKNFFN